MRITRRAAFALLATGVDIAQLHGHRAMAEPNFPNRPIRLVVPYVAGGSVDLMTRGVGHQLSRELGHPVVVDNRPGATTVIGTQFVARAAPDGYTLLSGGSNVELNRYLMPSLPYDAERDLTAIAHLNDVPFVLLVNSGLPVASLSELVAYARARPGDVTYASFGIGGSGHLSGELFNSMSGVDTLHVPYAGNPPALLDVAARRISMMFCTIPVANPEIASGRVRALAVTSMERLKALPNVPTLSEAGLPGYESTSWTVIYARRGTPETIIERLNMAFVRAIGSPEMIQLFENQGFVVASPREPEAVATMVRAKARKWAQVIESAGIKL